MKKARLTSLLLSITLLGTNQFVRGADPAHSDQPAVAPPEAISKLKEGNARYTSGNLQHPGQTTERRTELVKTQHPFATILSCSDSRVPPEIVFDQGLGDLFVVRVAGNIADDAALASMEYAIEHLGPRLIVGLGHERCGAVDAAVKGGEAPGHLGSLITAIAPAVASSKGKPGDRLDNAVRANVARVVEQLRSSEPILA